MSKILKASYIIHRAEKRIKLQFEPDPAINIILKNMPGARWSHSLRCWHIPQSKSLYNDFKKMLPEGWQILEKKHAFTPPDLKPPAKSPIEKAATPFREPKENAIEIWEICQENKTALEDFTIMLALKAYSPNTIRTYKNEFSALLQTLKNRPVHSLSADDVKRYVLYCVETLQLSENSIHSRLNALKFYFEQVLRREKIFVEIPRPKKPFILPKVLGEQEIGKLFNALENKKHKAILFTAYSAGLRVSEVVALELRHIDSDRMQILIEKGKGKKDRYVMLSPVLLDILRNYLKTWKPRPKKYLFEALEPGEPMSSRLAQHVFIEAKRRAGLKKHLSFHSLRHSFATHLLESGVDIKYIRDLLGHFSINTTTRYLHVKRESLVNIKSPLDELYKSGNMDFNP